MASSAYSAHVSNAKRDSTLYLKEIPSEENTTINLCNYFCKFGNLLAIVSPYNGDQSAASVTFSTPKEAKAALNNSEPLLNNRFIKMSLGIPATASESASTSNDGQKNDLKCNLCNKVYASNWHLNWHIKRMHSGTGVKCNVCSESFASNNMYKKHIRAEHSTADVQENIEDKTSTAMVKSEYLSNNNSDERVEKIAFLRVKNKALKKTIKGNSKAYSKALKSIEKLKINLENQLKEKDDTLKEKDAALVTIQQNNKSLQEENHKLSQNLKNEQMKVDLLRETLDKLARRQS